jgi:hypothetical protein
MTASEFDTTLAHFLHRVPFLPFRVNRRHPLAPIDINDPYTVAFRDGFALRAKADLNDDRFYYHEVTKIEDAPQMAELKN